MTIDQINSNTNQQNNSISSDETCAYTALIVEDEDINYFLASKLLKSFNIKSIRAINGQVAVDFIENNNYVDIILMDIRMPIMDGYEATKIIKSKKPGIPIIVQTAFCQESDKIKAYDSGCDDYLKKPLNRDVLKDALSKYIKIN